MTRSAGILLHITSLPSRFGIGDLGRAAYEFVDFLFEAGQSVWQILPLCPTSGCHSPYSSYSAFAGNMLLLSPELLVTDNWLAVESLAALVDHYESALSRQPEQVDFDSVTEFKQRLLQTAFDESGGQLATDAEYQQFCNEQAWWLDDFAKFEALREHFGQADWTKWPTVCRQPNNLPVAALNQIQTGIQFSKFKQFLFESQWNRIKKYANEKGIKICGDMPIFVAFESADVWANQSQFLLDSKGNPLCVAGVPPDYFSKTGQLWGNPLYDWDAMETNGFAWWCDRFRRALNQYDLLRVDHFRGFDQYWKVPAGAKTAVDGAWVTGPKDKPFLAAERALGKLPIWAEDLGDIDQDVHDLRDRLGFPTMRVLQFGYAAADDDFHRHTTYAPHSIAYTGTHDNDTVMGWYRSRQNSIPNGGHDALAEYLNGEEETHIQIIELLYRSLANVAIVPLQDAIGLGNSARMNVPGVAKGNWRWRCTKDAITSSLAKQLRILVVVSERLVDSQVASSVN